jgi:predicted nucleic acid-binding protein
MILDTNALSALAEREPALGPILRKAAQIGVPVIMLGEYRYGTNRALAQRSCHGREEGRIT